MGCLADDSCAPEPMSTAVELLMHWIPSLSQKVEWSSDC